MNMTEIEEGFCHAMDKGKDLDPPMSKRLATYLPDGIYDQLEEWASKERRSISNLAAFLLEMAVREQYGFQETGTHKENGLPASSESRAKQRKEDEE
jgi:hypothetical protein